MKLIREKAFETNSSSSHPISLGKKSGKDFVLDTIYPDQEGKIVIEDGEYGWEFYKTNDAREKASYALTSFIGNQDLIELLEEVIKEHTDCEGITFVQRDGYIDHQSTDVCPTTKEDIKDFIFNKNSWLFTGNDNSPKEKSFYITDTYNADGSITPTVYKYELKIAGVKKSIKFTEYPDNEDIENGIESLLDRSYINELDQIIVDPDIMSIFYRGNVFEFSEYKMPIDIENKTIYFVTKKNPILEKPYNEYTYEEREKLQTEFYLNPENHKKTTFYIREI